jgi:hypothetical protein
MHPLRGGMVSTHLCNIPSHENECTACVADQRSNTMYWSNENRENNLPFTVY